MEVAKAVWLVELGTIDCVSKDFALAGHNVLQIFIAMPNKYLEEVEWQEFVSGTLYLGQSYKEEVKYAL